MSIKFYSNTHMEEEENKNRLEKLGLGKNIKTAVLLVGLIAIPIVIGSLAQAQNLRNQGNSEDVLAANEANSIVERVGALMELPDEDPTVATVSDVESLRDQQFFQKAQNGDNVIIFPNAQKAILYRPSTNKIVEIALYTPPSPTQVPAATSPAPTSTQSLQDLIGGDEEAEPTPSGTSTNLTPTSTPGPTLPL